MDNSTAPYRHGWRVLARAIRAIIMHGVESHELHSLRDAAYEFHDMVGGLDTPTPTCQRCGTCMGQSYGIALADIDQAFEACDSQQILQDWSYLSELTRRGLDFPRVLVRRGQ